MCARARTSVVRVKHVLTGGNMRHATHRARPRFSALSSAIAETLQSALATARRPQAVNVRSAVISASSGIIVTSALAVGLPAVVKAQEPAAAPVEEVTVTGSRIRRQDFSANAPVVSIDEAMFDDTSSIGVETVLNRL